MEADRARSHYGPEESYFPLDSVKERYRIIRTIAYFHSLPLVVSEEEVPCFRGLRVV
jgi:hypothetical protein